MIGVAGQGSTIATYFMEMASEECCGVRLGMMIPGCSKYLICAGLLQGRSIGAMLPDDLTATFSVNFAEIAAFCDGLFKVEPEARVVVIGSESGFSGSFDMAYAGAKAALHLYVETKRLSHQQQLVAIAPSIIQDAGMTTRRTDEDELARRRAANPKKRFVTSREVASLAHWLLGPDGDYVSGTVIRMNGGERR